jgi:hypothetical protein
MGDALDVDEKKILLVVFGDVERSSLVSAIRRRHGANAEVRIVAPPELSRLRWLFMDVDKALQEARQRAQRAADSLATHVEVSEPAHPDPRQAIEDALRTFGADEVVVVTHAEDEANWQEQRALHGLDDEFDVPVTVMPLAASGQR